jgi:taurine dioxygenase
MQINPLSDALGAEVVGVDVANLDDAAFAAIRAAFLDHLVLVFRDQHLTPESQIAFTRGFGELEVHLSTDHLLPGYPEIIMISNKQENGRYIGAVSAGDYWHSDLSCQARPNMASLLYALELPSEGGQTEFCNQYKALETLLADIRARIAGKRAIHTFNRMRNPRVHVPDMHRDDAQMRYGERAPDDGVHPIIRTHPETGRKALYVSRRFTIGIEGMDDAEAQPLLDALFEHQLRPDLIYRHQYRLHDLIMWDNRCTTHHAAGGIPPGQIRHMHRTTLAGDVPF